MGDTRVCWNYFIVYRWPLCSKEGRLFLRNWKGHTSAGTMNKLHPAPRIAPKKYPCTTVHVYTWEARRPIFHPPTLLPSGMMELLQTHKSVPCRCFSLDLQGSCICARGDFRSLFECSETGYKSSGQMACSGLVRACFVRAGFVRCNTRESSILR